MFLPVLDKHHVVPCIGTREQTVTIELCFRLRSLTAGGDGGGDGGCTSGGGHCDGGSCEIGLTLARAGNL
jgi:hypothetical protein